MQRITEEQMLIMCCYLGTKEEVINEMMIAIPFIEDLELREMTEDLLVQIEKMTDDEFTEDLMDAYSE